MTTQDDTHLRNADLDPPAGTGPTTPPPPVRRPRSAMAFARNIWRGLTSMRTALILLFLLAIASLPGALLPQWSLNASKTQQYLVDHPTLGPVLNKLGFFEVFASPWYAAIYLLLFTSLVGCLVPRSWEFVGQLRGVPVATPRNLARLPHHDHREVKGSVDEVSARVTAGLTGRRGRRWRVVQRSADDGSLSISAERGYLREVGNLVFHLSLLGLLVAVAIGKLFGYEGSIIVTAGDGFCSVAPVSYDNFRPGLTVDGTDMNPFCVQVDSFQADYTDKGQAIAFKAGIRYQSGADLQSDQWQSTVLQVNDPLRIQGERLYLLGHGYTPKFSITFPDGQQREYSAPFAPAAGDPNFTSQGAVKVTDPPGVADQNLGRHQLAIVGIFAPTALVHAGIMSSAFPGAVKPGVAVDIYRGDLGMEAGRTQSVFAIDQSQVDKGALVKQARVNLYPGDSTKLDDGTVVTFTGYAEWVSLQTSYDPAQWGALVSAILLLAGLMVSLTVKRRRVWFRIGPPGPDSRTGRTVVEIGGLARTDQAGYGEEFTRLAGLAGPSDDWAESSGSRTRKGL